MWIQAKAKQSERKLAYVLAARSEGLAGRQEQYRRELRVGFRLKNHCWRHNTVGL